MSVTLKTAAASATDESGPKPPILPPSRLSRDEDPLNKSISSAFFHHIKTGPPPVETPAQAVSGPPSDGQALEVKRRETAAAVGLMKERLKAMGILGSTQAATPALEITKDSVDVDQVEREYGDFAERLEPMKSVTSPQASKTLSPSQDTLALAAESCRESFRY